MITKYSIVTAETFNKKIFEIAENNPCQITLSKRMLNQILKTRRFNVHLMSYTHEIDPSIPEHEGLYVNPSDLEIKFLVEDGKIYHFKFNLAAAIRGNKRIFFI